MIHPTAEVEASARIGSGTRVWHYARVRQGARLGQDCVVGTAAFVDVDVVVGDRVKIENAAQLFSGVEVGDGVFIGPGAIITNDRYPRATRPDGTPAGVADWEVGRTKIGFGSSIGAGAVVVAGADVGAWSMIGAGAVVTQPVADHAIVVGNPARAIGWACRCGRPLYAEDARPGPDWSGIASCRRDGSRYQVADGRCRAEQAG